VSQTSGAIDSARLARRSTRIERAVPLTIVGVDAARGPYREHVSTLSVNCHGCKYESKYEVLNNSVVILELGTDKPDAPSVTMRGRVKWAKRPPFAGAMHQTAIELDDPGNIWGVASPPQDWLPFIGPRDAKSEAAKPKPFSIPKVAPAAQTTEAQRPIQTSPEWETHSTPMSASTSRPVGELMRNFQQQMESILSEAASAAIRERATATLAEARTMLREEAARVVTETVASHAAPSIEESVQRVRRSSQESTLALQTQWTMRMEEDVQKSLARIEERHRELDLLAESMAASAIERLQRAMEASRREGIDRIMAGLKEQFAPLVEQARTVMADLKRSKEEAARIFDQSMEEFSARTQEVSARFDQQFETLIQERLAGARSQFEHAGAVATNALIESLGSAAQQHQAKARVRLQEAIAPVSEATLNSLEASARETSLRFANELNDVSRNHLESVARAISELAVGIGKPSRD